MPRFLFVLTFVLFYSVGFCQELGCTDTAASNYDSNAANDDGSCVYCSPFEQLVTLEFFQSGGQDWTGTSFSFTDQITGTLVFSGLITDMASVDVGYASEDICLEDGCYHFQLHDVVDPSQLSYNLFIHYDQLELSYSAIFDSMYFLNNSSDCDVDGCVDPDAENYNPYALLDDGSCYFECDSPLVNDNCSGAITAVFGEEIIGSLCCAQADEPDLCAQEDATAYGVWYHVNSGDCDTFGFVLENLTGANVSLTIFKDEFSVGCDGLEEIACCGVVEGQCSGDLSSFTVVPPNSDYYMFVYTTDSLNCGEYSFKVDCEYLGCTDQFNCNYDPEATLDDGTCTFDCSCAEPNNACFTAIEIEPGFADSASTYCLSSFFPPDVVGCDLEMQTGVWYSFLGTGSEVTLSSCGSIGPTRIDVFTTSNSECTGTFSCAVDAITDEYITSADNGCSGDDTELIFNSEIGETYFVYLSSTDVVFMNLSYNVFTPGDLNGDDNVDTSDLLTLLSQMGCEGECAADFNNDDIVNVIDLLVFLGLFG